MLFHTGYRIAVRISAVAAISIVISLTASYAAEKTWKTIPASGSPILFRTNEAVLPGAHFETKGWDDGYRYRSEYFGNGGPLGSIRRIGIWYYDLAGGRHFPDKQDVRKLISDFQIFKNRQNTIQFEGTVISGFGAADYAIFTSNDISCTMMARTFGSATFHIGTFAGTSRIYGYLCESSGQTITADDVEYFVQSIGIRNLKDPINAEFTPSLRDASPTVVQTESIPQTQPLAPETPTAEQRLLQLKSLLDKGLINKVDYDQKKQDILNGL